MFDIFQQFTKLLRSGKVCIDNNAFTLHYKLTVVILLIFSVIISSRKYFGDPIDCTTQPALANIIDNYCWFNSYVVVPKVPGDKYAEESLRFEPVINQKQLKQLENHPKYKAYFLHAYQWIEFILILQAMCFFLPQYLWRYCFEQGRVKTLTENFSRVSLKQNDDKGRYEDIIKYFKRNRHGHFEYSMKFIICEIIAFANVLTQFLLVQRGLGVDWRTLAEDFMTSQSNIDPTHPINQVFPNIARCEVPLPSGAGHPFVNELCVLPVNVFISKMYIFLWFYFYVLTIISAMALAYRLCVLLFPKLRIITLKRTGKGLSEDCVRHIKSLGYADYFLLSLVGKNMDPFSFKDLVRAYGEAIFAPRPSMELIRGDKKVSYPNLPSAT